MRVLLVTQFFPPETGGTPNRLSSFARALRAAGHEVTVICAKPNHPEGVIWDEYRGGIFRERTVDGIRVVHTWVYTRPAKNFVTRVALYLSFMLMAVVAGFRLRGRFDVIVASSPPLFVGVAGWLLSRLQRARLVFDVRDLWPDLAVAMGELNHSVVVTMAESLERFIYLRSDGISTVTDGFCEAIRERCEASVPVVRVSNATEPERFRVDESKSQLRKRLSLPRGFLVTYAGNIGICQGLGHIVEAAEILAKDRVGERPKESILFLGDGPVKDELARRVRERGLDNVILRDRVQLETAISIMAASDALLVPLADDPIFRMFIPSKLFDSMAVGRPVLLSVDGEARRILEAAGAGLYYPAEDGEALARAISELQSRNDLAEMGRRGTRYVARHFTRKEQARRMIEFLESIVGREKASDIEARLETVHGE